MQGQEKRKNPRLNKRLPFEIGCHYVVISTQTKNISSSGAYCYVDRALPIMSRVKIAMSVPVKKKSRILPKHITCEGVVLRYDPPQKDDNNNGWNTAVMFTRISKANKAVIAEYVKNQLTKLT